MSPRAASRLEALGFSEVYDYVAGKVDWGAAGLPYEGSAASRPTAGAAADPTVPTCSLDTGLEEVRGRVRASGFETCIVVDEQRVVLGRLGRAALERGGETTAEHAMAEGPSTVRPSLPLADLLGRMAERGRATALVTTLDGRLVGLVRREDAERLLGAKA